MNIILIDGEPMNPNVFTYLMDYNNCSVAQSNCELFEDVPDIAFSFKEQALVPENGVTTWNDITVENNFGTHTTGSCFSSRSWQFQSFCIDKSCTREWDANFHGGDVSLIR